MRKKKWSYSDFKVAVDSSNSLRQLIIKLNLIPAGGNYSQLKNFIKINHINTDHFKGQAWRKGLKGNGKKATPLKNILVKNSTYQSYKLKNRLFEEKLKLKKCEICSWSKMTFDGRIPVELDHINGIKTDNRISNIRILCPNCHSLQSTHRGKNIKSRN